MYSIHPSYPEIQDESMFSVKDTIMAFEEVILHVWHETCVTRFQ